MSAAPRMPFWRREAEGLIAEALGAAAMPWVGWGEALPEPGSALSHLVLSMVGHAAPSAERVRVLVRIGKALAPQGTIVAVDHNRPRGSWGALAALVRAPWVPGLGPATRWRRLAYPTAREVQGAGFRVERLLLAAGERIQIVIAGG
jgi:hypothetical protein